MKLLEDNLTKVMNENEILRKKVIEIDNVLKERARGESAQPQEGSTGRGMPDTNRRQLHELDGFKSRIKNTEEKYREEIRQKEFEYERRLAQSSSKYEKREKELRHKIKELEQSHAINEGKSRSGSEISKSSRSPSPLHAKRLLGGSSKPPFTVSHSHLSRPAALSRDIDMSARVSEVTLHNNIKHLESLVQRVMEDYKSIRQESKQVSSKLESIEKVLHRQAHANPGSKVMAPSLHQGSKTVDQDNQMIGSRRTCTY